MVAAAGVLLGSAQVVLGLIWWLGNLSAVPAYGDTPEYVDLSKTLAVDQYRTLAYPLLVRASRDLSTWTGLPWQVPLYLVQTLVAVVAAWYLVRSVLPTASRRVCIAIAAVLVTTPLVIHYAATVLSDSLATSLFVIGLCGVARAVVHGDRSRRTLVVTSAAALAAALLRTEKAAVLLSIAAAVLLVVLIARLRSAVDAPGRLRAVTVLAVAGLALPSVAAMVVNGATQTADYGRPRSSLTTAAVSRVVWPHLGAVWSELPAQLRQHVSRADAAAFDANNNSAIPMTREMEDLNGGGDALAGAAVHAALRCCLGGVASATAGDAVEYALAPITFAREGSLALASGARPEPGLAPSLWDMSRMSAAQPRLTYALLMCSWWFLAVSVVSAAAGLAARFRGRGSRRRRGRDRSSEWVLLIVWSGTVVNGCFFAVAQGADANVRYALSGVVAVMGALTFWLVESLLPDVRRIR